MLGNEHTSNTTGASSLHDAYDRARRAVVVIPDLPRDVVTLTGRDRISFMHSFCTNDIKRMKDGDICETFLCNSQGKIVGHGYVYCLADQLIYDTPSGYGQSVISHLDRYIIREDVQLKLNSSQWRHLLVVGPQATHWLEHHVTDLPTQIGTFVLWKRPGNAADAADGAGWGLVAMTDSVQGPAYLIKLFDLSPEAVLLHNLGEAVVGPPELYDILRVEQGTPFMGRDIGESNLPQEVDRNARAISFHKGCYLGQETVARIDALGHVNRAMRGLRFMTTVVPEPGMALRAADKPVGHVTSAVQSPRFGVIGLGYVRREHLAPGTRLDSDAGPVQVTALPHGSDVPKGFS